MAREGFNIQEFKSTVENRGIQKNNKFLVKFFIPPLMRESISSQMGGNQVQLAQKASKEMQFWCDTAVLPGIQLSLRQVIRYGYGPIEKKPFAPLFNDVTFTVMQDQKNINWSWFHSWLSTVVLWDARRGILGSPEQKIKPFEIFYKEDYIVDLDVTCFNDMGNPVTRIVLRQAYPFTMGDLPLNWADNNTFMKMPISFTFHDWYWAPFPENEMLPIPTPAPNPDVSGDPPTPLK